MSNGTGSLLSLRGIRKSFGTKVVTEVLRGIDLEVAGGEFAAMMGPSGSGKSTLLNIIGLLDRPTAGDLFVRGQSTHAMDEDAIGALRSATIGFVFQFHHLISALTAAENVMMPLAIIDGSPRQQHRTTAVEALRQVGLADRADARPPELSGGQQQRVAIARALVHNPPLVLADEPTGNLDTKTADDIFRLMRQCNDDRGITFLIVTHDERLAGMCDRIVTLVDGIVHDDRATITTAADDPNSPR